jgi:hypothetical protein
MQDGNSIWWDQNPTDPAGPAGPAGPGGGGRGGGGGGGGGGSDKANWDAYMQKVLEAMGGLRPGADTLTPRINQAVDADIAFSDQTWGGVADRSNDPYANMQFSSQQFDPQTAALMQSQGMGGDAALAQQMAGKMGLDSMTNMWNDLGKAMSANQQASNTTYNADRDTLKANNRTQLMNQKAAMLAAAQANRERMEEDYKMKRLEAILGLLSQGLGMGQNVGNINFAGLLA